MSKFENEDRSIVRGDCVYYYDVDWAYADAQLYLQHNQHHVIMLQHMMLMSLACRVVRISNGVILKDKLNEQNDYK